MRKIRRPDILDGDIVKCERSFSAARFGHFYTVKYDSYGDIDLIQRAKSVDAYFLSTFVDCLRDGDFVKMNLANEEKVLLVLKGLL